MQLSISFIVPVYNRPDEIKELLDSMANQTANFPFEIVIVEDGSKDTCVEVVASFSDSLDILYLTKTNSGPGDSRNYGMQRAKGNYFIILDSDCILPPQYLDTVIESLRREYVHCFGGPDAAMDSFSDIQKAINYSMTSLLTTGGIRGGKSHVNRFQPRSFNMGLSKEAFIATNGFGDIHPGEDPDLVLRLWKLGYDSALISKAFVYHKRRISWSKFYTQVNKFGMVRPILNKWHPNSRKVTYWFPSVFVLVVISSFLMLLLGFKWLLVGIGVYLGLIWLHAIFSTASIKIGTYALLATLIQFYGYGKGFLISTIAIDAFKAKPREKFPKLFFD